MIVFKDLNLFRFQRVWILIFTKKGRSIVSSSVHTIKSPNYICEIQIRTCSNEIWLCCEISALILKRKTHTRIWKQLKNADFIFWSEIVWQNMFRWEWKKSALVQFLFVAFCHVFSDQLFYVSAECFTFQPLKQICFCAFGKSDRFQDSFFFVVLIVCFDLCFACHSRNTAERKWKTILRLRQLDF